MTTIAALASAIALLLGAFVAIRERGYSFDLRRRSKSLPGGRRAGDPAT